MSEKLTLTSTGVIPAMETLNRELLAGHRRLNQEVITALYDDRGQLRGFGKITRELPTSEAEEATHPKQAANRG